MTPSVVAQRECRGVFYDSDSGERLITHQPPPLSLELGGGFDLIMLHALPFGWNLQHLPSRREP